MRAMVLPRFGGPESFEQRDVPRPVPGPGELLVRIVASGTNPVDAKIRASGAWAGVTPPAIIGYDASGVVEGAGPGVPDYRAGDEVFFTPEIFRNPHGTYAEYTVVPAAIVAPKPLVEQGKLRAVVDVVLPLARVAEAHRRLDSGHGRGKIVLEV